MGEREQSHQLGFPRGYYILKFLHSQEVGNGNSIPRGEERKREPQHQDWGDTQDGEAQPNSSAQTYLLQASQASGPRERDSQEAECHV